jgi:hypothetical protein
LLLLLLHVAVDCYGVVHAVAVDGAVDGPAGAGWEVKHVSWHAILFAGGVTAGAGAGAV